MQMDRHIAAISATQMVRRIAASSAMHIDSISAIRRRQITLIPLRRRA